MLTQYKKVQESTFTNRGYFQTWIGLNKDFSALG